MKQNSILWILMTEPLVLLCGTTFSEEERTRFCMSLPCASVDNPTAIGGLDHAARARIRAMARKGRHSIEASAFDLLPNLGLVASFGVGYDDIDVAGASARDIRVTNTPDVLNDDVADLAVALMLAVSRDVVAGDRLVRSGSWAKGESLPLNRKMSGRRAGICGLGRIGREIANRLAALKMDIHYHSRSKRETPGWTYHCDVESLALAVDFLVVALVGGEETRNYVSREAISALGPSGVIVNISRGSTIDEQALLEALESGGIAGAGLDVFLNEPRINERFYRLHNVVLQPHHASSTQETRRAMAELQLANVLAFMEGRSLLTPVN